MIYVNAQNWWVEKKSFFRKVCKNSKNPEFFMNIAETVHPKATIRPNSSSGDQDERNKYLIFT